MIQPISGTNNPYNVSQIQQVAPRPPQSQELEQVQPRPLQDAAIFQPSEAAQAAMASGYGPDGLATSAPASETLQASAPQPAEAPTTPSAAERAQNLYQQPESVIREFTQMANNSIQQGQQVDIMV
ncbi:hypothetical protein LZ24_02042 [Desulfobotulus alkaliphilus]|uniref:Uncharacterized protein n=1 Tax=Desulfobotulus alkaliphilus TaxID=622671 RepID=A0A562RQB2_9BACT|nr:hypothetical protein [Desulfobotulus alkaliphilus]TWI71242.1 hypothetical protein LZ24_02042 [Desulfobotulus alkaliphilus]